MAGVGDVRVEESLRVKIGSVQRSTGCLRKWEAKNLLSGSGGSRNTFCALRLDSEEIFRTGVVEKSLDPFFGEEFSGEIPKKFRSLSVLVCESGSKSEKVIGKVSLKKDELYKYHQKEHWFPLVAADAESDVHGKVHLEVRFDEYLNTEPDYISCHRMTVKVTECSDLRIINGACNPYAVVTLLWGKLKNKEIRRTAVKKKTICPQFEEVFCFDLNNRGQNHDRNIYSFDDIYEGELSVSLWHDDSKVAREVLGNKFPGCFLGEIKIQLRDLDLATEHKAWYCLQGREPHKRSSQDLGSVRLKICYTADYVFQSHYYSDLKSLLLTSADVEPVSSSAAYILGHIVDGHQEAAQPLVRLFYHHEALVPLVRVLADREMSVTTDPNTLLRGNSLLSKMVDELMKLVGLPYLHDTLKGFVDSVCDEPKACEIDPTRLKEGENLNDNLANMKQYVTGAVEAITGSGLVCPPMMRDVFCVLKEMATHHYPENSTVRYHAVSSFVFLRFFAPAILGPRLFDIRSDTQDMCVQRTLTLISKTIITLVNIISSAANHNGPKKEEYMVPLLDSLTTDPLLDSIRTFLDIISSATGAYSKSIEAPIVLKDGMMIKRAQGRNRLGRKNFKKRYFCLTNQHLSYAKSKGDKSLCLIPVEDILAVERLQEDSFKMKYMFQVVQQNRALYVQAGNCVEEKEWLDVLTKVCQSNKNRLKVYHPAAFINNHWLCCKAVDPNTEGCTPVSGGVPVSDIQVDIDPDRELEKIHSLFLSHMERLDAIQEACGVQVVYAGTTEEPRASMVVEDPQTCFSTVSSIQQCVISLEQEHKQYQRRLQRSTVIGSREAPIGDDLCGMVVGSQTYL
ncbi:ras GTPase-activating protein 3-like [Babylonia areolata]|uniref:ras GTPase-activating protein 3-like n=1 Tax=Babylonia areolata TaxID=304850 RepID=UPI003FD3418D